MLMQLQMCWRAFTQCSSHVVEWLGSELSPPWPGFDSRHGNSTSEIFRRTNCRILSKALEPTFQISVVDKFGSPPHHYNDYYLVFLFHFDNSLIYRPRHNTSVETLQLLSSDWLMSKWDGLTKKIVENFWFCSTFLHSINWSIYTREKSTWKTHKIDGTATFTIALVVQW